MQIIAIANQKGGTAKTTTAAALAQAAAAQGQKALAVDLDPQRNLSFALQADIAKGTTFDLLNGTPVRQLIQHSSTGPDIIPASRNNSTISRSRGSAKRLRAALLPIQLFYDVIIIDTPPTAGELQYNAIQAATGPIIPIQAETFSIQGLYEIADAAAQIKKSNPALNIKGILLTRLDSRSILARQMTENAAAAAQALNIPYLGAIRAGVAVQEAQALQENLFSYAPKSKPALDYLRLYKTIMGED